MRHLFTNKYLWWVVAAILAIHMLGQPFAIYPKLVDMGPTWLGLDSSGRMTLNYALLHNWNWGNDIVYTYGPFAFLATRIGFGIPAWIFLVADLLLVINFFFIFKDFILRSANKILACAVLFVVTLLVPPTYGGDLPWVYIIFIFYWMYRSYEEPRAIFFAPMLLLIIVSFYLKLNTGLFAIFFLCVHLAMLVISKKMHTIKALSILGVLALALIITAYLFHVSILSYARGAFEIVKGYNDLLYLNQDHPREMLFLSIIFWAITLALAVYALVLLKQKNYSQLYFAGFSIIYIFLLRKQSILRNDVQHLYEFFGYAPLILICGDMLSLKKMQQHVFLVCTLAIYLLAFSINRKKMSVVKIAAIKYSVLKAYSKGVAEYRQAPYLDQQNKRIIPQRILSKIGEQTVDVFPWDSQYLLQNKLNYTPRPCFQTLAANTEYLERINYEFYLHRAPEYVIFDYDAIDESHPFCDATQLNYFLMRNYVVEDTFTSNERWRLSLHKKAGIAPVILTPARKQMLSITDEIPTQGYPFMKIDVKYNLSGKLNAFHSKPSPIRIVFVLQDGRTVGYKTSTELLRAGIMTDKLLTSTADYAAYMQGQDALPVIKSVKLDLNPEYFSDQVTVEYFNIK